MQKGHEYNKALMCSRTAAKISMRPNESHGAVRNVAGIGRISSARVPSLS